MVHLGRHKVHCIISWINISQADYPFNTQNSLGHIPRAGLNFNCPYMCLDGHWILGILLWRPYAIFAGWIFLKEEASLIVLTVATPAFFTKSSVLHSPVIYLLERKQVGSIYSIYFSICLFFIIQSSIVYAQLLKLLLLPFQFYKCMLSIVGIGQHGCVCVCVQEDMNVWAWINSLTDCATCDDTHSSQVKL